MGSSPPSGSSGYCVVSTHVQANSCGGCLSNVIQGSSGGITGVVLLDPCSEVLIQVTAAAREQHKYTLIALIIICAA